MMETTELALLPLDPRGQRPGEPPPTALNQRKPRSSATPGWGARAQNQGQPLLQKPTQCPEPCSHDTWVLCYVQGQTGTCPACELSLHEQDTVWQAERAWAAGKDALPPLYPSGVYCSGQQGHLQRKPLVPKSDWQILQCAETPSCHQGTHPWAAAQLQTE